MSASTSLFPVAQESSSESLWEPLTALGWIDLSAIAVLLVFFVLGLFKGMVWQLSRIATLLAAYVVSGAYGPDVAKWLSGLMHEAPPRDDEQQLALYLAYILIFVGVLIALSLIAVLLQKLVRKAGLSFYDRVGGGVLGIATGGCVVLFLLGVLFMFFPRDGQIVNAAEQSHSAAFSRKALDLLGTIVPEEMRSIFGIPAADPGNHQPQDPPDPPNQPR